MINRISEVVHDPYTFTTPEKLLPVRAVYAMSFLLINDDPNISHAEDVPIPANAEIAYYSKANRLGVTMNHCGKERRANVTTYDCV